MVPIFRFHEVAEDMTGLLFSLEGSFALVEYSITLRAGKSPRPAVVLW